MTARARRAALKAPPRGVRSPRLRRRTFRRRSRDSPRRFRTARSRLGAARRAPRSIAPRAHPLAAATPRTRVRTERRRRGVCARRTIRAGADIFRFSRRAGGRLGSMRARGAGRTAPRTRATRTSPWWFRCAGTLRSHPRSRTRTGRPRRRGPRRTESSRARPRNDCLLYTSPSPRDKRQSRMPSSA